MTTSKHKQKDKLHELLSPIQQKLTLKRLLNIIGQFSFFAIILGAALLLSARFLPFPYGKTAAGFLLGLAVLASFLYSIFTKPNLKDTARIADGFELKERVVTALDINKSSSRLATLQRNDTVNLLEKRLPVILEGIKIFSFTRVQIVSFLVLLFFWFSLIIFPNPLDNYLAEQKAAKESKQAVEEKLNDQQEKIKINEQLSEENKQKLLTDLENLKEQLKEDSSIEEQLKQLEKYKKELAKLQLEQESKKSAFKNLEELFSDNQQLQDLIKEINQNNQETLTEQLAEMQELLSLLPEAEKEALVAQIENAKNAWDKLAKELDDQDLQDLANNLQKTINNLQNGNNEQAMTDLISALAQANKLNSESQALGSQLANTISALQQAQLTAANGDSSLLSSALANNSIENPDASNNPSNNGQGQNSASNNGNSDSGIADNGDQPSGNSSSGSSSSSSSNSNGSGTSGNSGSGNTNGGSGANGSGGAGQNGQGGGAGLGSGSHTVSIPAERINSEGIVDSISGPLNEGNGDTQISNNSNISPGVSLPYEEVYNEYYQYVRESIDRNQIPAGYENIVRDYFSSIEP